MNTDKIYAESLANEYAPNDTSKVIALRKLDAKAKLPATIFTYSFGIAFAPDCWSGNVSFHESYWKWFYCHDDTGHCDWHRRTIRNGHQLPDLQESAGKRKTNVRL